MVNANLMRVIGRRRGLPVALGILYLHGARAQGWAICGLNFPGHFLLRLDLGAERSIIDPFNGGKPRDAVGLRALLTGMAGENAELRPEHTRPVGCRDVLRSEEHSSELQSLIRISYAVFCWKKQIY